MRVQKAKLFCINVYLLRTPTTHEKVTRYVAISSILTLLKTNAMAKKNNKRTRYMVKWKSNSYHCPICYVCTCSKKNGPNNWNWVRYHSLLLENWNVDSASMQTKIISVSQFLDWEIYLLIYLPSFLFYINVIYKHYKVYLVCSHPVKYIYNKTR